MNRYPINYQTFKETPFMGVAIELANKNPNSICQIAISYISEKNYTERPSLERKAAYERLFSLNATRHNSRNRT